ncbi:MAG: ATP-binding protein [Desulfurococcales archaeon]|nr:ATP-binding protein [Desulfurococcales archaeon]
MHGSSVTEISYVERFKEFISGFRDESGRFKYVERLRRMASLEGRSLIIEFADLYRYDALLAEELVEKPLKALRDAEEAVRELLELEYPELVEKKRRFHVRITGLFDTLKIRDVRSEHVGKLVQIEGIVTRMHPVRSRMVKAVFRHDKCESEFQWPQDEEELGERVERPGVCPVCGEGGGRFLLVADKSDYVDWQKIVVQEKPEDVPGGQMPRSIEVQLRGDIVDSVRPGDRISVVGIVKLSGASERSPLYELYIDANSVRVSERALEEVSITREDEEMIREIARDPWVKERIIASIAPSIYGYWDLKEAIALLLFGGVPKILPDGTRIRGDIHVLFIGDPGVAKSQLLQAAARIAPRSVFTTGKGSTAAGLCVSGDTLVYSGDGIETARSIVESRASNVIVSSGLLVTIAEPLILASYTNGALVRSRAYNTYALSADSIVRIRTGLGHELKVTPETRVLSLRGGRLEWVRAGELREGDYIVAARRLPQLLPTTRFTLLDLLPGNTVVKLKEDLETILVSINHTRRLPETLPSKRFFKLEELRRLLNNLGLDLGDLEVFVEKVSRAGRGIKAGIRVPVVGEELLEFLAHLYSMGRLTGGGRVYRVKFRVTDRGLADNIALRVEELFNLKPTVRSLGGWRVHVVEVISGVLGDLLLRLGIRPSNGAYTAIIPSFIAMLPEPLLSAFLRAFFDVRGGIRRGHIYLTLDSEHLARQLSLLLRRFGVVASLVRRGSKVELRISDYISLKAFKDSIGFSSEERMKALEALVEDRKEVRSPRILDIDNSIVAVRVKEVFFEPGGVVYDVTVDDVHNFVAEGFIVHNTAAVVRDPKTNEFYLEAGALVLADGGVAVIDELDKMEKSDRVAIHEAMEQQYISISKAGIVARLNARTSILAAGNPKLGVYDPQKSFTDNVNLPPTILSRFDLMFVVRDIISVERDRRLVSHILEAHSVSERFKPEISPDLLKKYIIYARRYVRPRLTPQARKLVEEFFVEMRSSALSYQAQGSQAPIPITARQLEAIIRLAEAHARMALRDEVTEEDAEAAIRLMSAYLQSVGLDVESGVVDVGAIMTGAGFTTRRLMSVIVDVIKRRSSETGKCVKLQDIVGDVTSRYKVEEEKVRDVMRKLHQQGVIMEVRQDCFSPVE